MITIKENVKNPNVYILGELLYGAFFKHIDMLFVKVEDTKIGITCQNLTYSEKWVLDKNTYVIPVKNVEIEYETIE